MSIAEKLTTIAENVPKVYNAGYEKGKSEGGGGETEDFWGGIQDYGNRANYEHAFRYTSFKVLNPKYGFENMTNAGGICQYATIEEIVISNSKTANWAYAFAKNSNLKKVIGTIKISSANANMAATFSDCTNMTDAGTWDFSNLSASNTNKADQMFGRCSALVEVRFIGVIPCTVSFSGCNKLSYESLMSIINALADYSEDTSGVAHKVTLGSTNLAKLSTEEIQLIEDKGWTYA